MKKMACDHPDVNPTSTFLTCQEQKTNRNISSILLFYDNKAKFTTTEATHTKVFGEHIPSPSSEFIKNLIVQMFKTVSSSQ